MIDMAKKAPPRPQKPEKIYAFIDSQNLNLGTSNNLFNKQGSQTYAGWKLDFQKFRKYLEDKFRVQKTFLFIGHIAENQSLYNKLINYGYELVFKPTVKDGQGKPKGNVDAELVLYAARIEYDNYDKAIIVSGDGDFLCLHEFLASEGKLLKIIIPNEKSESSLLKKFQPQKVFLQREKQKLEYKQKFGRRNSISRR
jgi:uncharacterized LabA/DUF88 family protein